jgi:hypothetical protein
MHGLISAIKLLYILRQNEGRGKKRRRIPMANRLMAVLVAALYVSRETQAQAAGD